MGSDTQNLELRSWTRLRTFGILVDATLIGAKHDFAFEAERLSVSLPDASMVDRDSKYDEVASCARWRMTPAGEMPFQYRIEKVDVSVYLPGAVPLPGKILKVPCNASELLSDAQQAQLNDTAGASGRLATRADTSPCEKLPVVRLKQCLLSP